MATRNSQVTEVYPITNEALCVIVNNDQFTDTSQLSSLPGNRKDADDLQELLESELKFKVKRADNCSKGELKCFFESVIQTNSERSFVVMVFILSHSNSIGFYTPDKEVFPYSDVFGFFDNCTNIQLIDKPSLFLIQTTTKSHDSTRPLICPSVNKDFIITYATTLAHQHLSHNSTTFVQVFIECMRLHAGTNDILNILTLCNARTIATHSHTITTLTKTLHLKENEKMATMSRLPTSESRFSFTTNSGSCQTLPEKAAWCSSNYSLVTSTDMEQGIIVKTKQDTRRLSYLPSRRTETTARTTKAAVTHHTHPIDNSGQRFVGHCIIVDNNETTPTLAEDGGTTPIYGPKREVVELMEAFESLLGFNVMRLTNVTELELDILLANMDTFPDPSALVFIVLQSSTSHQKAASKDRMLQNFENEKFQTAKCAFPKIVIFHSTAPTNNEPLQAENITVPVNCIYMNMISSCSDSSTSRLLELTTVLQKSTEFVDIAKAFSKVGSVIINNLKKQVLLPVRKETDLYCSFMEKGKRLMSKLVMQYKFWSEIRIDTITAFCTKTENPELTVDSPITAIKHKGTLRAFLKLDAAICKSMNPNIRNLKQVQEELLTEESTEQGKHYLKEINFVTTFNVDRHMPTHEDKSQYRQQIKQIRNDLTMELEATKIFLLGEKMETEL